MANEQLTMNPAKSYQSITLVKGAIHNPTEPRHFMTVNPLNSAVRAKLGNQIIASSSKVWRMQEVAHIIISPVIYFHRQDVAMELLTASPQKSHCPLKGDATYFHGNVGGAITENIAWSYEEPIEVAHSIKDLIAFDSRSICVEI